MISASSTILSSTFSALADPTRRTILERLSRGEATVSEVAEPLGMSLPAVSKHLKILEKAGLILRKVEGRTHILRLQAKPMSNAMEYLEPYRKFWEQSFDRLAEYLENSDED